MHDLNHLKHARTTGPESSETCTYSRTWIIWNMSWIFWKLKHAPTAGYSTWIIWIFCRPETCTYNRTWIIWNMSWIFWKLKHAFTAGYRTWIIWIFCRPETCAYNRTWIIWNMRLQQNLNHLKHAPTTGPESSETCTYKQDLNHLKHVPTPKTRIIWNMHLQQDLNHLKHAPTTGSESSESKLKHASTAGPESSETTRPESSETCTYNRTWIIWNMHLQQDLNHLKHAPTTGPESSETCTYNRTWIIWTMSCTYEGIPAQSEHEPPTSREKYHPRRWARPISPLNPLIAPGFASHWIIHNAAHDVGDKFCSQQCDLQPKKSTNYLKFVRSQECCTDPMSAVQPRCGEVIT